jgi:hypothetical protein
VIWSAPYVHSLTEGALVAVWPTPDQTEDGSSSRSQRAVPRLGQFAGQGVSSRGVSATRWRGIATRYDKYASTYIGGVQLAAIVILALP